MEVKGLLLAGTLFVSACGQADVATEVAPTNEAISYQGRFEWESTEGPLYELPGTTVRLGFTGTSVRVKLRELSEGRDEYGELRQNSYDVLIDGVAQRRLEPAEGEGVYLLAEGLAPGSHELELFKRTEPWIGQGQLLGFVLDKGASVSPVSRPDRRVEFIGDSVAVGLGVEAENEDCDYSARLQNHAAAFPSLVAADLRAEHIAFALSGVGVSVNFGGSTNTTMPHLYKRALPRNVSSSWSFDWKPQAVVVNLGTSDFTNGKPDRAAFISGYSSLLEQVREVYPDAFILVVTGPMLNDRWPVGANHATAAREHTEAAVQKRMAEGDQNVELLHLAEDDGTRGYGCDFHPSKATQRWMADQISSALRARLGW